MNTIRNLRYKRINLSQCLRFCSKKGCEESKKCADLKASSICSPDGKKGKAEKKILKKVTVLEGDGVGCELIESLKLVCEAAKVPIEWDVIDSYKSPDSNKINPVLLDSLECNKVGIKGPIASGHHLKQLRKAFGLYAYVALCRNIEGQKTPYGTLDCVVIRDVMEGEYSGIEHSVVPGILQSIKVSTAVGADRISRFVFDFALKNERKKITVAHKANIMQLTDGNFLTSMRNEASNHLAKIKFEERYMDTACLNLVMHPELFDVLVSSSMYGDVLVMMASSIMGGKGLCPGYYVSKNVVLYDTLVKSNLEMAGKDMVNPTGLLFSTALMLRHLKLDSHADKINCAVQQVYKDTDIRTKDTGGKAKCSEFTNAVCGFISKMDE
ncbi:probable isocitrate dehydrogenase [NAD] subunit alpha, mitochondrial [Drosophila montana]|uniref:probable isocitrate dehydrogenase [NAD] subunit alpha, mitochondrial n=1 Tax=Drosophila montana TaxID=40370 RepID=UPI00313E5576